MDEQFLTNKWQYPPPATKRKSGEIAGNPRDIYDLGKLYESGKRSFSVTRDASEIQASWHWDAKNLSGEEYAWFVHEGEGPTAVLRGLGQMSLLCPTCLKEAM